MKLIQWETLTPLLLLLWLGVGPAFGALEDDVKWLLVYEGDALPHAPQWVRQGGTDDCAQVEDGTLHLVDNAEDDVCYYRAIWEPQPGQDMVVEARIRVVSVGREDGTSINRLRPLYSGSPIGILVGDGHKQEGLALASNRITTFCDRICEMPTTDDFHLYRLVISGDDMSIYVDGEMKIRGKDAFWKPTTEDAPFILFGSNCGGWKGDAHWDYVKLGVREKRMTREKDDLKITVGEPWSIPRGDGPRCTRPYLYNVGAGLLLLSVAQGPDAIYEPYGILKSTDTGKTWTPIEGLQEKTFAPQPMIRMNDGSIFGASRWTVKYQDGIYTGIGYHFDPEAESFRMYESKILVPAELGRCPVFDRHIFKRDDDTILAVIYDEHAGYLLRTTDRGETWECVSTIGAGEEPGVAFLSDTEAVAILRQSTMRPLHQVRSHDGGQTWSEPVVLEAGSVDPDVVHMSNGVLACSYGRPGCNIMLSTDQGETWSHYRVISEAGGFCYTSIREVSPGRLLYVHDAPPLTALYIDVERVE